MSRMSSIRNLAKATVGMGAAGAAIGGGAAYATGGDIGSGMWEGAKVGAMGFLGAKAGRRVGRAGQAMGMRSLRSMKQSMPRGKDFLRKSAAEKQQINRVRGRANSRLNTVRGMNIGGIGAVAGGIAGGMSFATLASNQGATLGKSSLEDRFKHRERVRAMNMRYNLAEAQMKKQIWQRNR